MAKHQTRRDFIACLGVGAAALALPLGRAAVAHKQPNIIHILIDDLGYSDPGCYGNRFCETPHIDRLVTQGMVLPVHLSITLIVIIAAVGQL